jgi:hypothetical protein
MLHRRTEFASWSTPDEAPTRSQSTTMGKRFRNVLHDIDAHDAF